MADFNFLPSIEIKLTRDIKYIHKLFEEHPDIDIYKQGKYNKNDTSF